MAAGSTVRIDIPSDLGPEAVLAVADGADLELTRGLLLRLERSRRQTLDALATSGPVYGVTTGMGSQSGLAVAATNQPAFQGDLMLARAVGTEPWLDRRSVRALLATRLRTLLDPEAGVSPALARALAAALRAGVHPAVPATGNGAAGEIIPLAHLGGFLSGRGEGVADDRPGRTVEADVVLRQAGLTPYAFGVKEGVAFLQGVPTALAQCVLLGADARALLDQQLAVAAGEIVLVRAPRDPYDPALGRGDPELSEVLGTLRSLVGEEVDPRSLQAPVSFRVAGPTLAHLLRCVRRLDDAVERSLDAVSTSPALVGGRFLGTAGFDGFDLAAHADALRLALLHAAEVGTARVHRMLDPRTTGLPAQLSLQPGRRAGLVAVHKRAVGVVHQARREASPASLGAVETSAGQEDVQSFALEATAAAASAASVLRDVTACELVTLHQAVLLSGPGAAAGSKPLDMVLRKAFRVLPDDADDRPLGREVGDMRRLLHIGWAHGELVPTHDAPPRGSP